MELGWACSLSVWLLFLGSLAVRLLRSDLLLSRLLLLRVGLLAVLQALGQAVLPLPLSAALTGAACLLVSASTARRKRIPTGGKAVVVTGESGGREPSAPAKSRRAAPPSRGQSRPALSGAGVAPAEPVARSRAGESSGPLHPPRSGPPHQDRAWSPRSPGRDAGAGKARSLLRNAHLRPAVQNGPLRRGGPSGAARAAGAAGKTLPDSAPRRGLARPRPSAPAPSRPSRASPWRTAAATRPESPRRPGRAQRAWRAGAEGGSPHQVGSGAGGSRELPVEAGSYAAPSGKEARREERGAESGERRGAPMPVP